MPSSAITISQAEAPVLYASDFAVAEDGIIFIADAKDGNIKCYDPEGKLLSVTGRRGPGPEEFGGPYFCDYQAPFLSVLDSPKFKVHIYERAGMAKLSKVGEIYCMMCLSDVILSGKSVLVDAPINIGENAFFLTKRDFGDKVIRYLCPQWRRYGYESKKAYEANYSDIAMLTAQRGFISVTGNRGFYVSDVRLKIAGFNLDGLEVVSFGTPSANYREPRINQKIRNAFEKKESEPIRREREKVSYITGILSDEHMVGVLFSNYDVSSNSWKLYLQRYGLAGNLLSEDILFDATNYDSLFNYYFQRETGILFVMSEIYGDDSTDDYKILGYRLR